MIIQVLIHGLGIPDVEVEAAGGPGSGWPPLHWLEKPNGPGPRKNLKPPLRLTRS